MKSILKKLGLLALTCAFVFPTNRSQAHIDLSTPKDSVTRYVPWVSVRFEKDMNYVYKLGLKFIQDEGTQLMQVPTSRLYKNGFIVDEIQHHELSNNGTIRLDSMLQVPTTWAANEMGVLVNSGEFCGAKQGKILFGRIGDKLIREISIDIDYEGEGILPANFTNRDFRMNVEDESVVVITTRGFDFAGKSEQNVYYELEEHFAWTGSEFESDAINQVETLFVTAETGLSMRKEPFVSSNKEGALAHGQQVRVVQKTDLKLSIKDRGRIVEGHWVEIENPNPRIKGTLFVFDGFLSESDPTVIQ